jgi:hypothetical protein
MEDRPELVLATANPDKAREIVEILGPAARLLGRPAGVGEVDETGETLELRVRDLLHSGLLLYRRCNRMQNVGHRRATLSHGSSLKDHVTICYNSFITA